MGLYDAILAAFCGWGGILYRLEGETRFKPLCVWLLCSFSLKFFKHHCRLNTVSTAKTFTEFILKDVARRVAKAGKITDTAAYQIYRAQALGESRKAIKDMLRKQLGITHSEINRLFHDAAKKSYGFDTRGIPWAQPFKQNGSLQQIVSAAAALAKKDFTNLTQTLGLTAPDGKPYPLQKAYQKCMDGAFEQVFTGASDYNTAIRQATHALADKGVRFIDYESGVSTSLEAAVRRNIMGGLGLMDEQIVQADHDMLGCNGWEISAHANSAPDHEDIQAQADADAKIAGMRFDAALSSALRNAKVKNPATLTGLLDRDALKLADGKILGLAEQLESIKKDNGFLFESDEKPPRIVAGAPGAKDVATMNQKANEALRSCFGKE